MEDRGMSVFNVLTLFGGLAMFLFGMELMGQDWNLHPVESWRKFWKI